VMPQRAGASLKRAATEAALFLPTPSWVVRPSRGPLAGPGLRGVRRALGVDQILKDLLAELPRVSD
jgi:hypothetical protein